MRNSGSSEIYLISSNRPGDAAQASLESRPRRHAVPHPTVPPPLLKDDPSRGEDVTRNASHRRLAPALSRDDIFLLCDSSLGDGTPDLDQMDRPRVSGVLHTDSTLDCQEADQRNHQSAGTKRLSESFEPLFRLSGVFLIIIVYLCGFSFYLYGEMPAYLGGGKPRTVRIVVTESAKEDLVALGFQFSTKDAKSEPVQLLPATDKEYVFLTGTPQSSVGIRSDLVQAISYEGR